MNKKQASIIKILFMIISLPTIILNFTAEHHRITSSMLVYAICFSLPWVYISTMLIVSLIDVLRNRQERLIKFSSRDGCYKLVTSRSDVVLAFCAPVFLIALTLMLVLPLLVAALTEVRQHSYLWLIWFVPLILMMILMAILELAKSLTEHVCITEQGISSESVVKELGLHTIDWGQVTSIKVIRRAASNTIKRVVVYGRNKRGALRPVIIAGSHPDILRILQDIREHAPDTVVKTLLGQ
ncbi:MAG: hypothetical protein ACYC1M_17020 [Armatimonadota bacterium]